MNLVEVVDGAFELRWTWLPYWLATNGKLKQELETELKAAVASKEITDHPAHLAHLHNLVCKLIQSRFPQMEGLETALMSLKHVRS